MLEIAFESRMLRTVCESEAKAIAQLGEALAADLRDRLADIRAAQSLIDLQALGLGIPQSPNEAGIELFILDLSEDAQLVFCANHIRNPITETGRIDWAKVSRIKILEIRRPNEHH